MAKIPKKHLEWRRKQKRGAIMKPETFATIKHKEEAKGLSAARAEKAAGKAYWQAEEAKYKKAHHHSPALPL